MNSFIENKETHFFFWKKVAYILVIGDFSTEAYKRIFYDATTPEEELPRVWITITVTLVTLNILTYYIYI